MSVCGLDRVGLVIDGNLFHDWFIIWNIELEFYVIGSYRDTYFILYRYDAFRLFYRCRGCGNRAPIGGSTRYFWYLFISVFPWINSEADILVCTILLFNFIRIVRCFSTGQCFNLR